MGQSSLYIANATVQVNILTKTDKSVHCSKENMQHSISVWNFSRSPNYVTNVDMIYPYSEVPYIGNYKLVKIPISTNNVIVPESELVDHVDYWGEGRIDATEGSSGFSNCYNVNHQYQLVSNGPDRDRKIPNRIPVISYTNCSTSSYIKDNSVKLVTLMGAPINKSCAQDIARMIHPDLGQVVVYGFKSNAQDVKNLEEELAKKKIFFCHGLQLPKLLKTVTLFNEGDHRGYLNITDLCKELYGNVTEGSFDNAVNIIKTLDNSGNNAACADIITQLLKDGIRNTVRLAYTIWKGDDQNIFTSYFPVSFKLIFNQDYVKIMDKKNMFALKLDNNVDINSEKIALGDDKDKESPKIRWKIVPNFENNTLYFKILNTETGLFLKLDKGEEEKLSKGGLTAAEEKSHWFLDPIKVDDDMLFYIVNREFNQGLKLAETSNSNGTKQLLGHKGSVYGQPLNYGWYISPWSA